MSRTRKGFSLPADLAPGDAPAVHGDLLAWLENRTPAAALDLEGADAGISPCALQLLLAATRSVRFPAPRLGTAASGALEALASPAEGDA